MKLSGIKALTFDTRGTLLDWHTDFRDAFSGCSQSRELSNQQRVETSHTASLQVG